MPLGYLVVLISGFLDNPQHSLVICTAQLLRTARASHGIAEIRHADVSGFTPNLYQYRDYPLISDQPPSLLHWNAYSCLHVRLFW